MNRKGKLLVNAGKGCKYREVPLNKDARQAFLDLDQKTHAGSDAYVFLGQRGVLSPRAIQLLLKRLNIPAELGEQYHHTSLDILFVKIWWMQGLVWKK